MPASPSAPSTDSRLNGWKDIANYLGKGVRTVQRWEKVYGLPVHRIGQDHGDIVFAFKSEIDRWLVEFEQRRPANGHAAIDLADDVEEPPQPVDAPTAAPVASRPPVPVAPGATTPTRIRRRPATVALAAAVLTLAVAAGLRLSMLPAASRTDAAHQSAPASRQPSSWRVADDRLVVFDDAGHELWVKRFDFDLSEAAYEQGTQTAFHYPVYIEDLDGDGAREVVFLSMSSSRDARRLYVFNADGSPRFEHHPAPTVHFGSDVYSPPWAAHVLVLTRNADGTRSIWVTFIHGLYFPTLLEQLDANGTVVSQYWSDGYIASVTIGRWHGAPAVFVGATNNETLGGSLAIFAGTSVRGRAPAMREAYRCVECDAAAPDAYLVFPRSCLLAADGVLADVSQAWEDGGGTLMVVASQGRIPRANGVQAQLAAYYAIPADLLRADVEISREFLTAHATAREEGRIDHDFGPRDARMLQPVLRWEGERFVPLSVGALKQ